MPGATADRAGQSVLDALHEELGLEERRPLQDVIDVDAVRQLRNHGGQFELTFSAYGREITVTDQSVDVSDPVREAAADRTAAPDSLHDVR
jgi:hypothetical protein